MPYSVGIDSGSICNKFIKEGAYLVEDVADIVSVCGYDTIREESISLDEMEEVIYKVIKNGATSIDELIEVTNLKVFELLPKLTVMEIKGVIIKSGAGEYSAVKN